MARPRLELQTLLEGLLGNSNVYFQPPPTVQMKYPAIVYHRDQSFVDHANNGTYRHYKRYQLTVISQKPDPPVNDAVEALPLCAFYREFKADNLNQYVFNLYF